jgi:hypothetical protein
VPFQVSFIGSSVFAEIAFKFLVFTVDVVLMTPERRFGMKTSITYRTFESEIYDN